MDLTFEVFLGETEFKNDPYPIILIHFVRQLKLQQFPLTLLELTDSFVPKQEIWVRNLNKIVDDCRLSYDIRQNKKKVFNALIKIRQLSSWETSATQELIDCQTLPILIDFLGQKYDNEKKLQLEAAWTLTKLMKKKTIF